MTLRRQPTTQTAPYLHLTAIPQASTASSIMVIKRASGGASPIVKAKSIRLYDNTRISDSRKCLRFYYYRHIRDLQASTTSLPLIFGGAWHKAMEVVWEMILTTRASQEAIFNAAREAFELEWTSRGQLLQLDMEAEKEMSPRTPMIAAEMLVAYVAKRYRVKQDFELVSIERPFVVPLDPADPTLFYIGKIDKIVRQRSGKKRILGIEHKTTTAYRKSDNLKFKTTFLEGFSPNSQVDGYLYALHMSYPGEVQGVWVDGALLHKSEEDFTFIPVERQIQHLDAWLWEVRYWIDQIEANTRAAAAALPTDKYLAAFPKNTNSCHDFNAACQFLELCKAWPNPVGKPTPPGYRLEHWDPLDHIDKSKLEMPK